MKSVAYTLLIFTIFISNVTSLPVSTQTFSCASVTEIPQAECEALVSLFNSTNGDGWKHNENWLTTNTPSNWWGVIVTDNHVTTIGLPGENLIGTIPPELGNLSYLNQLILSNNFLEGSIPPELGNLHNLTLLTLSINRLSGVIPTELGNLENLTELRLSYNYLTGTIPVTLGEMVSLLHLDLRCNLLTGPIPLELADLAGLLHLEVAENLLTGALPPELGGLSNLRTLDIAHNQLVSVIPLNFTHLSSLTTFYFYWNNICEPVDPEFLAWKENVMGWVGTDLICPGGHSTISGYVLDRFDIPVEGVDVSFGATSVMTNNDGFYSITLPVGLYQVIPSKSMYLFAPPERNIALVGDQEVNFTGHPCIAPSGLNICYLQPGDILLLRAPVLDAIFSIGGTYFTHAAMYLGMVPEPGGGEETFAPRIAEAQSPFVDAEDQVWEAEITTTGFWSSNNILDWVVIRPQTSTGVKDAAIAYMRDKAADPSVIFDIFASREDEERFYCSKLVWKAYKDIPGGTDLEVNIGFGSNVIDYWVTPDDLYYSILTGSSWVDYLYGINDNRFILTLWSPAHVMLVDPSGNRTGYDPATATILNEIPLATYAAPPDTQVETITAVGVGEGWKVTVTGYDTGEYVLDYSYLIPGSKNILWNGTTAPGQIEEYEINDPTFEIFIPILVR